ncbi:MAG: hypothetical protein CMB99_15885 [Flavobacteriaceae bacterium]|jgi:SPP1 gp7 family putative phage head morphogenesis protein|nr:hypothetical protein [Flavobacteriaceae bacterium]|tara:strand:+ start:2919 stop:3800 length:882 start_codon:yes stop_codon:yes gene_type:complete
MANYAVQKRATLDRVTARSVQAARNIFLSDLESKADKIFSDLNRGIDSIKKADIRQIKSSVDTVVDRHLYHAVKSAVSDGMQEVTPENELGLWKLLPDTHDPILTLAELRPALADKRDKLLDKILKEVKKSSSYSTDELTNLLSGNYLKAFQSSYRELAKKWVKGESTVNEVKAMITTTVGLTTSHSTMVFRTETTNYFNRARADYFKENTSMDYMQIFSITDGRRSKICEDRHGWTFPLSEATQKSKCPAFHPHCRTVQRPLTTRIGSHNRQIEKGIAMNESRFEPLPKGWE